MKIITFVLCLLALSCNLAAEPLVFDKAGFSIKALDSKPGQAGMQPLTMMLTAKNGFAANVNVQIQAYPGSVEDYIALSEAQFEQMGLQMSDKRIEGDTLYFEYSGSMSGRSLHFYSKAIKKDKFFYLATATDLEQNWVQSSARLKEVINSLQLQ